MTDDVIAKVYDSVRAKYADMGYPVTGDRLVIDRQPTYSDGRPIPADVISPESSGGNVQNDGVVRVNPDYRSVMRYWGLRGSGRKFLRHIVGHELGHHVDRTVLSRPERSAERRRLLRAIRESGFRTVYTDSYGPDTPSAKLDKELLAEYLASQASGAPVPAPVRKQAAAAEVELVDPNFAAIMSQDVYYNGAEPRVLRDNDGMLQVVGPKGNVPSDVMIISEREAFDRLEKLRAKDRRRRALRGLFTFIK